MCVRFAPIFWDFNVWKCYIPKWLIIYCSPIIHKLREPTQNGVIQFMVTKRGQISKWMWVSKPHPTIGMWLCMSFRWKSQLHTLHRDLSFDAILRAFFVVRIGTYDVLLTSKTQFFCGKTCVHFTLCFLSVDMCVKIALNRACILNSRVTTSFDYSTVGCCFIRSLKNCFWLYLS